MVPSPDYARQRYLFGLMLFAEALLLVATGCTSAFSDPSSSTRSLSLPPATAPGLDWEEAKEFGPQNVSVWGVGFDEAFPETSLVGFHTSRVEPRTTIAAPYHFLNRSDHIEVRRLFILIDEKQQRGAIGDDPHALYTDVTVGPGEEVTVTTTIPPLEPGAHDLIVVSILNPDDPLGLNCTRYTLLAGGISEQSPRYYVTLEDTNLPLDNLSLFVTDETDAPSRELREWSVTQVAPRDLVEYAIYAGYMTVTDPTTGESLGDTMHRFAILTFLDERQVPTQPDGGVVFYGQVSKDAIGRILGGIRAPNEVGPHNLLILLVENPGVVLSSVVRGPSEPGPATLLPWFTDAEGVVVWVEQEQERNVR